MRLSPDVRLIWLGFSYGVGYNILIDTKEAVGAPGRTQTAPGDHLLSTRQQAWLTQEHMLLVTHTLPVYAVTSQLSSGCLDGMVGYDTDADAHPGARTHTHTNNNNNSGHL